MANAPDTSPYLLVFPDVTDLPNSRTLTAGTGLSLLDTGPTQNLTIQPTGNILAIANYDTSGYLAYNATTNTFSGRTFTSDASITITNPDGVVTTSNFSVNDNTSIQQIVVSSGGVTIGTRKQINFIQGSNASVSVSDNGVSDSVDITISTNAAPANATYITQTPNSGLSNEQALSALATGILKSTTSTGVISIAVANTDYMPASQNLIDIAALSPVAGRLFIGSGSNIVSLDIGTSGQVLQSNGTSAFWAASPSGAPTNATYITQTPNGTLTNEQPLSLLATGILKSTTATGVVSIAVEGTDYWAPNQTPVNIDSGGTGADNATQGFNALSPCNTIGDMIYFDGTNNVRLAAGASNQVLGISGGIPTWLYGGGDAPVNGPYITYQSNSTLTNEQNLGALTTGLLLSRVSAGVATISAGPNLYWENSLGNMLVGPNNYSPSSPFPGGGNLVIDWAGPILPSASAGTLRNVILAQSCPNMAGATDNIIIGFGSGPGVTTGDANTLVGGNTGALITSSSNLTAIGYNAGDSQPTYTNCTFLGYGADASAPALSNATALGYNASVSTSNSFILGSVANTNVGINTTAAGWALTVGSGGNAGIYVARSTSQTIASNGGVFAVSNGDLPYFTNQTQEYVVATVNTGGQTAAAGTIPVGNGTNYNSIAPGSVGQVLGITAPNTVGWINDAGAASASNFLVNAVAYNSDPTETTYLPAFTYANGTAGVGATITFDAVGAISPLFTDNVTTVAGNYVLYVDANSTSAPYGGLYVITTKGDGSTQEVWTRATTFDTASDMLTGTTFTNVAAQGNGSCLSGQVFTLTNTSSITVGTTPLTFSFSGAGIPVFVTAQINIPGSAGTVDLFQLSNSRRIYPISFSLVAQNQTYTATFGKSTAAYADYVASVSVLGAGQLSTVSTLANINSLNPLDTLGADVTATGGVGTGLVKILCFVT